MAQQQPLQGPQQQLHRPKGPGVQQPQRWLMRYAPKARAPQLLMHQALVQGQQLPAPAWMQLLPGELPPLQPLLPPPPGSPSASWQQALMEKRVITTCRTISSCPKRRQKIAHGETHSGALAGRYSTMQAQGHTYYPIPLIGANIERRVSSSPHA